MEERAVAVPLAYPPGDPWYRRRWAYVNRPDVGCGCLDTIAVVLAVLSLLIDAPRFS